MGNVLTHAFEFVGGSVYDTVVRPFLASVLGLFIGGMDRSIAYENNDKELKRVYFSNPAYNMPPYMSPFGPMTHVHPGMAATDHPMSHPQPSVHHHSTAFQKFHVGDVTNRPELQEKMKCRNCNSGELVRFIFQCGHLACLWCNHQLDECWNEKCKKVITGRQWLDYELC